MKTYKDIIPDYERYLTLQTSLYQSFESDHPEWSDPQEEAIREFFADFERDLIIADIGCGDGFGLEVLKSMGFRHLMGFDASKDKIAKANEKGLNAAVCDVHKLPKLMCDVILCSHVLEHCYYPGKVLDQISNSLVNGGLLYLILPYPDLGEDEAHGGKYELGTMEDDNYERITAFIEKRHLKVDSITTGFRTGDEIRMECHRISRSE